MSLSHNQCTSRDRRIDLLRGLALLAVFIDHIPGNLLHMITLQSHALSDAADVFVFLAGYSAWLAYARATARQGTRVATQRVLARCGCVYFAQICVLVACAYTTSTWLQFTAVGSGFLPADGDAFARALILYAQPAYLDVLPLYVCLLLAFPLLWAGLHRAPRITVAASMCVWLFVNLCPRLNFPEWLSGQGWTFNPFEWQLLFTLGAVAAALTVTWRHPLRPMPRITAACWILLCETWVVRQYACLGLPGDPPIHVATAMDTMPHLLRLLSGLAIMYLALTSPGFARLADSGRLLAIEACGRHSLAVFGLGTVLSLLGRLTFQTAGDGLPMQVLVNGVGISVLVAVARVLERRRSAVRRPRRFAPSPSVLTS